MFNCLAGTRPGWRALLVVKVSVRFQEVCKARRAERAADRFDERDRRSISITTRRRRFCRKRGTRWSPPWSLTGNPSSVHGHGRAAAQPHRDGARPGGGAGRRRADAGGVHRLGDRGDHPGDRRRREGASASIGVVVSAGEHTAVLKAAEATGRAGDDASGSTRTASSGSTRSPRRSRRPMRLASSSSSRCIAVNNETGVVQPMARIEAMVGPTPHYLFVDAVQALGKLPLEFAARAPDMMAVSAHKIGGPAGVGALLVKGHADQVRLIPGGGQETGRRGGTEVGGADRRRSARRRRRFRQRYRRGQGQRAGRGRWRRACAILAPDTRGLRRTGRADRQRRQFRGAGAQESRWR